MGRLTGKVALVTGAARGQGRAHAVQLAGAGADLVLLDIDRGAAIDSVSYELGGGDELAETGRLVAAAGRRAVLRRADVRSREQLAAAVADGVRELGRLDIVVANAGILSLAPYLELTDEMFTDVLGVNLWGTHHTCQVTIPYLQRQGGGAIVVISSVAGMVGFPNQSHYNASKHATIGLVRSLATEFGRDSIRVNAVLPGAVATRMIDNDGVRSLVSAGADLAGVDLAAAFGSMSLLPTPWVEPVDVANAVVWLASDEARYVTGIALPVDAGYLARP